MNEMDWTYSRYEAQVTLDGSPIPASGVRWVYELNAVPLASVSIPTGRDAETGQASAAAAILNGDAGEDVEIRVRRVAAGDDRPFGFPPDEWVKVFEGRLVGVGHRRDRRRGAASLDLAVAHWLGAADESSIFSRWSHPSNPAQYTARLAVGGSSTGASGPTTYWGAGSESLSEENLAKDLWADALQPFFTTLAGQDMFHVPEQNVSAAANKDGSANLTIPNDAALAVLKRIKSRPGLKFLAAADPDMRGQIRDHLTSMLADVGAMTSHTLWDVLVNGLAANYLFAIVPRFEDALLVPYIPTRRAWYGTIDLDDYGGNDLSGRVHRPLRAVGVMTRYDSTTGLSGTPTSDPAVTSGMVGGWYQVPGVDRGFIHIEPAPAWAARCTPATTYAPESAGASGRPVATADRPDAAGGPDAKVAAAPGKAAAASTRFLSRYARSRASQLVAADRRGVVTGPLRADLAPGSSARIIVADDAAAGGVAGAFVGSVARISSALDCRARTATTSFDFAHLRTQGRNAAEGGGTDEHPLYADAFLGAAMRG